MASELTAKDKQALIKFALSVVIFLGLMFWWNKKPTPKPIPENLKALAADLREHYKNYPVGGGWYFVGAYPSSEAVLMQILLPTEQANHIMDRPSSAQLQMAHGLCPSKLEGFYAKLSEGQRIDIELGIVTGKDFTAFVSTSCKAG